MLESRKRGAGIRNQENKVTAMRSCWRLETRRNKEHCVAQQKTLSVRLEIGDLKLRC